jgi:chemotaxis protein MotB
MSELDRMIAGLDPADPPPQGNRLWLVTFSDLFCLLLACFALLFSMSQVEIGKWKDVTKALSRQQESPFAKNAEGDSVEGSKGGLVATPALDLGYLGTLLGARAKENTLLRSSVIYLVGERLVISLPGDLLFAPGSATLEVRDSSALFELGTMLRNIANDVDVVGHSDPTPVTGAFASNWDLSLARAATVAQALRRGGFTRPIAAYGVADSHFEELPNDLPWLRRLELARRVDVVLTPNTGVP